jgi:hypothetical protein
MGIYYADDSKFTRCRTIIQRADVNYNSRNNNIVYQNRKKAPRSHYIWDIQSRFPVAILMFQALASVFQISFFLPSPAWILAHLTRPHFEYSWAFLPRILVCTILLYSTQIFSSIINNEYIQRHYILKNSD